MNIIPAFRWHKKMARCLVVLLTGASALAVAQEDAEVARTPWLQAEFIVFRQLDTHSAADEAWPAEPVLGYPAGISLVADPAANASAGPSSVPEVMREPAFIKLPPEQRLLQDVSNRLAASSNYRVLQHLAWRQPLPGGNLPTHVLLTGGKAVGEHFELEGYVSVLRSHFLHVETHLWLNDFAIDAETARGPALPAVPTPQSMLSPAADMFSPPSSDSATDTNPDPLDAAAQSPPAVHTDRSVLLREKRRVRLGQRHYIDHPLFGVIVTLRAYDPDQPSTADQTPADSPVSP